MSYLTFSDPAVQALQFLDVIGMKDPSQKAQFFRTTLTQVFPFIPRVTSVSFKKFLSVSGREDRGII